MIGDQAGALRDLVSRIGEENKITPEKKSGNCRVITITSGKGGVGKSNFSIFLAKALIGRGKKVLLFDGDMGLANLHILMGISAPYNIIHFLRGERDLKDVIHTTIDGIDLLPGSSGSSDLADMKPEYLNKLISRLESFASHYDYMIVDGGAGIGDSAMRLALSGDSVVVVLTPDPTSLADAYSTIKILHSRGVSRFSVVINMVEEDEEGAAIEEKLLLLTNKFLGITPIFLGQLPRNRKLSSCIRAERSVLAERGMADFAIRINSIASKMTGEDMMSREEGSFFKRLFQA